MGMPELSAVFPCAGSGKRFGSKKQFLILGEWPVFLHSLALFAAFGVFRNLILVIDPDDLRIYEKYLSAEYLKSQGLPERLASVRLVPGGAERHLSVLAGLNEIKNPESLVFIHDAARPLFSREDLETLVGLASALFEKKEGLLPAEKMKDTVKRVTMVNGETYVSESLPRSELAAVSTPQIFPVRELRHSFEPFLKSPSGNVPTDEGEIYFQSGGKVRIHYLEHANPKLTTADDLAVVEALFRTHQAVPSKL